MAEHGQYPKNATDNTIFPERRLFNEVQKVFRKIVQVAPVFVDKHLADNWADSKWLHDTAKELKIPLMAGSSLPVLWRYPPVDVKRGAKLKEIVAVSYHTLDAYGFHALEMVQCLAERTLMTSALLDALLTSKSKNGAVVPTDYLNFKYTTDWNWKQPPPPPLGQP